MTRIRKMMTKEMLNQQLRELLRSQGEDNVSLSRLRELRLSGAKETEMMLRKQMKESEEMFPVKKKAKLEWRPEDCAQSIGKSSKCTGEGEKKRCHYETFIFRGTQYVLEDSVLLVPENPDQKPYVAIIKDIYIQGKEGYVKLDVQWFYRPEDVGKKHVGNWESKYSRDLFYSFHRDEVFAESVKHKCVVNFVPENKQIPNRREHPGFIVQKVYDNVRKKLMKFSYKGFNVQQKDEIDNLVAKTILQVGDLPDIMKKKKTLISTSKRSIPQRFIIKPEETSHESSIVVDPFDYKSILEKFDSLTGDSDRDKSLEVLLEAVKHICRTSTKKQAGDYDFVWPNDVVSVVCALEHVLYDSLAEDIPKYNYKVENLADKIKNSQVLARRLLNGELKPEQAIKMTRYELTRGITFDEERAAFEEPVLKMYAPSTSKSVGCKNSPED